MGWCRMMVRPDGFIGSVMAIEGISDATVLMHGPDGCRKNLTVLSSKCYPRRDDSVDAYTPYYSGMSRIPCTGVVSTDYIFGSYGKVSDALSFLAGRDTGLVAVIPTPGAALIGDDCGKAVSEAKMDGRALVMESDLGSTPLGHGIDRTLATVVSHLAERSEHVRGTVNLIGLSILMKDWPTVVEEFTHILGLMGLEVVCTLGAGSSVDDIRRSGSAEFCVVICPEYARETVEAYRGLGVPSVDIGVSPVGFEATIEWICSVADATGRDPMDALAYVDGFRRRAFSCMSASRTSVRGWSFSIDGEASVVYPLTRWLSEDLLMCPSAVTVCPGGSEASMESLSAFLAAGGFDDVLGSEHPSFSDALLCAGNTARLEQAAKRCRKGIDISFPSISNVDFRRSPVFGPSGVMYILDRLMNP